MEVPFGVVDKKAPTPIVTEAMSVYLMSDVEGGGIMTVWAGLLNYTLRQGDQVLTRIMVLQR